MEVGSCVSGDQMLDYSSEEKPDDADNSIPIKSSDAQSSGVLPCVIDSRDSVSEQKAFPEDQALPQLDSDDDFFSVRGDFSRSCSNASSCRGSLNGSPVRTETSGLKPETCQTENKKILVDLLRDPFWSDQLRNDGNDIKLIEYLQDGNTGAKLGVIDRTPKGRTFVMPRSDTTTGHRRAQDAHYKIERKRRDTAAHCCFPGLSPRRGCQESKKPQLEVKHYQSNDIKQEWRLSPGCKNL